MVMLASAASEAYTRLSLQIITVHFLWAVPPHKVQKTVDGQYGNDFTYLQKQIFVILKSIFTLIVSALNKLKSL